MVNNEKNNNIEEMSKKENLWVCKFLDACLKGERFDIENNPVPSDAALEKVTKIIENVVG